ncbi:MAG: DUF1311 domain-containing protein [Desulfovibrio sp.]|nr:DUF1311 domain-containing protein [Desulfovibrio sp.]
MLPQPEARALTESEYKIYMDTNPEFASLDRQLNVAWKEAKPRMTKEGLKILLEDQREWLKRRDRVIKRVQEEGLAGSREDALILMLKMRIGHPRYIGESTIPGAKAFYHPEGLVKGPAILKKDAEFCRRYRNSKALWINYTEMYGD